MIDIIIPCYNTHQTLHKPLDSIVKQTMRNDIKVLLVDDCSDENYDSFIEEYKDRLNISVIRLKKNSGPGIAREIGIRKTNGKYITFMDSDDCFIEPTSVEDLYTYAERGFDLVKSIEYDQKRGSIKLLDGNLHGKLYRREYLEKKDIHFNDTRFHEDNYFNKLVEISGAKIVNIASHTYFYTYNKKSITNSNTKEIDRLEIFLRNYRDLYEIAKKNNYRKDKVAIMLKRKYSYLRKLYLKVNDKEKKIVKDLVYKYDKKAYSLLGLNYYFFMKNRNIYLNEFLEKEGY